MDLLRRRRGALLAAFALTGPALLAPGLLTGTAHAADPAYTVQTLHFAVLTGPANDTPCDIVGDIYVPTDASTTSRKPAILTTNGFGGSKADQAGIGQAFASRGYVVLSYSGLGFGGSTCKITLDDPDWDGKAGSQLVGYLGGKAGVAFLDAAHTQPAPALDVVQLDNRDHAGQFSVNDPRVGMIGGSYGGGNQFATASVDPRVDTIVPIITWNDLPYSLNPNNTAQSPGVTPTTPGATKLFWGLGFSALGLTGDLTNGQVPGEPLPCPNFADWVCPALALAGTTGYFDAAATAAAHHASVASYLPKITIPTLLVQGENDTLFNLNEAVATYKALKAQGTPVKMIWQSWGHSGGPAAGEVDLDNPDPVAQYETGRFLDWFDHYLKGVDVSTGPAFSWFRPWVSYTGNAAPAYASSPSFPVGSARTWKLSGGGLLAPGTLTTGTPMIGLQTFLTTTGGLPTSLNPFDVLGSYAPLPNETTLDLPGTFAAWSTPALAANLDVVGSPVFTVSLQAPTAALTQAAGPAGQLVLFVKLVDVAPDGKTSLIKGLEAPIRVPNVNVPVTVTLPAIVHRFAAGHQLKLVVAGGSVNYRGGIVGAPVTIAAGSGQTLVLPVTP
jgi:ABC-2 type transport system ATP-binding protein